MTFFGTTRSWGPSVVAVALLSSLAACSASPPPVTPPEPEPDWAALGAARLPLLSPCERPGVEEPLLCGTLEVREDRFETTPGRTIPLAVVVVPARTRTPAPEPVFIFAGGPGGAATERAGAMVHAAPLRDRDIVLVDQRGTGGSNELDCDFGAGGDALGELPEMFPPAAVEACAAELARRADLYLYTSDQHADDIEEVRYLLGYSRIHLSGGSYGTRAAMVFAQRYPRTVATLFLIGTDSPSRPNLAERGLSAERALEGVAAFCTADAACAALTPDLAEQVADLLAELELGPKTVTLADPLRPEETLTFAVGQEWLAEQLRLNLYYAFTSRALPWAVHRAHAEEDWEPLVQLAVFIDRFFRSSLADGLLLTVQCTEGMDFDTKEALARGKRTLFGNYRLEQQIQGCAHWPHVQRPGLGVAEPRPLDIPTVFVSGEMDAVTPPYYADDAAEYLPVSRHLVLAEGQHGPFDLENAWQCIHQIWAELIAEASVEDLDFSCAETMHRPPFITSGEELARYVREVLAPMV